VQSSEQLPGSNPVIDQSSGARGGRGGLGLQSPLAVLRDRVSTDRCPFVPRQSRAGLDDGGHWYGRSRAEGPMCAVLNWAEPWRRNAPRPP
jgi:hypothetical protein